jgi:hypothetical protein
MTAHDFFCIRILAWALMEQIEWIDAPEIEDLLPRYAFTEQLLKPAVIDCMGCFILQIFDNAVPNDTPTEHALERAILIVLEAYFYAWRIHSGQSELRLRTLDFRVRFRELTVPFKVSREHGTWPEPIKDFSEAL